jgi:hypothetical protein
MMMENAAAFGVNEQLKRSIPEPVAGDGSSTLWQYSYPLAMGALTGSVTGVVLCPADNVKVWEMPVVMHVSQTLALMACLHRCWDCVLGKKVVKGVGAMFTTPLLHSKLTRWSWQRALASMHLKVVLYPPRSYDAQVKAQYAVVKAGETAPSTSEMLALILKRQGALKGLFNGLDAQLMRDGPFYMVFFGSYELNRAALLPHMPDTAATFVAGGLAGMIGWTAVMPFDGPKSVSA